MLGKGSRFAGCGIHQHHYAPCGTGTDTILENSLLRDDRASAYTGDTHANINMSRPGHLRQKVDLRAGNHKLSLWTNKISLRVEQDRDSRAFVKRREHSVVNMALSVSIAVADVFPAYIGLGMKILIYTGCWIFVVHFRIPCLGCCPVVYQQH